MPTTTEETRRITTSGSGTRGARGGRRAAAPRRPSAPRPPRPAGPSGTGARASTAMAARPRGAATTKKTTTQTYIKRITSSDNTPYVVGGLVALGVLGYIFWPRGAQAAQLPPPGTVVVSPPVVVMPPPGMPGGPAPAIIPSGPAPFPAPAGLVVPPRPGTVRGSVNPPPGTTVSTPGLNVRSSPNVGNNRTGGVAYGTAVNILADAGAGWYEIEGTNWDTRTAGEPAGTAPIRGFVCNDCADSPGGPWIQRGTLTPG